MIDEQGLYDIYGLSRLPFWQTPLFKYTVVAVTCFMLVLVLYSVFKQWQYRKKKTTYWEQTLAHLEVLQKNIHKQQEPKLFYSDLTKVIKKYIGCRFNMAFEGKTDNEVFQLLSTNALFAVKTANMQALFQRVTPIKFGQKNQMKKEMSADVQLALDFVRCTLPDIENRG